MTRAGRSRPRFDLNPGDSRANIHGSLALDLCADERFHDFLPESKQSRPRFAFAREDQRQVTFAHTGKARELPLCQASHFQTLSANAGKHSAPLESYLPK